MKTNPPTFVSIGGMIITIRVDPSLEPWGEYRPDYAEIVLSAETLKNPSILRKILRHEMLHASFDIAGLSHLTTYEEEAIVRCVDNIYHPAWDRVRDQLDLSE
jgi:hypothetical protein